MALSKTQGAFSAWAAVAMGAVGEGAEIDVSLHRTTWIHLQAFLDTGAAIAHTGTQFIIQGSSALTVDENWADLIWWTELNGTCNPELSTLNPAPINTTVFTVASTTGYVVADVAMPWIALQDLTLANSELLLLKSIVTNTSLTVLDGSTRQHTNTAIFGNVAVSKMSAPLDTRGLTRLRMIANNDWDSNGAIINWRFAWVANLK